MKLLNSHLNESKQITDVKIDCYIKPFYYVKQTHAKKNSPKNKKKRRKRAQAQNLALNNLQGLICHKILTTNFYKSYIFNK